MLFRILALLLALYLPQGECWAIQNPGPAVTGALAGAGGGGGTLAPVGTPTCVTSAGSAKIITYSPTAGNLMVFGMSESNTTITFTVKDSSSTSFTDPKGTIQAGAARSSDVQYLLSEGSGITGFTITPSASSTFIACGQEYAHSSGVAYTATDSAVFTSTLTVSQAVTMSASGDLAFCSIAATSADTAFTPSGTGVKLTLVTNGAATTSVIEDQAATASGSMSVGGVFTGSTGSGAVYCVDIKK